MEIAILVACVLSIGLSVAILFKKSGGSVYKTEVRDAVDESIKTLSTMLTAAIENANKLLSSSVTERLAELKTEMDILMGYLPKQLTREELEEIVKAAVAETGASTVKDMGKIMSAVMPKTKGRTDGKVINEIARALLAN